MVVGFYPFVSILLAGYHSALGTIFKLFYFCSVESKAPFPFEKDSMEELAGDCQIFERMGSCLNHF